MRTRPSNKDKHYDQSNFIDLDEDGGADPADMVPPSDSAKGNPTTKRATRLIKDDDDFDADVGQLDDGEDDGEDQDDPDEDGDEDVDMLAADSDHDARVTRTPTSRARRPRPRPKPKSPSPARRDGLTAAHTLPNYDLDPRLSQRVYNGVLRDYARYSQLIVALFGKDRATLRLALELKQRWRPYRVLPGCFGAEHENGVLLSPWLTQGWEKEQLVRMREWWERVKEDGKAAAMQGEEGAVNDSEAELVSGGAEETLLGLLGPYDSQEKHSFRPGLGIAFSPAGLPVAQDGVADGQSSGWMFDVGGVPLDLAWAPQTGTGPQCLAVSVVPISSQAYHADKEEGWSGEDGKAGSVQLWRLESKAGITDGLRQPSSNVPVLASTVLSGTSRVTRLQWCPVPFTADGSIGLLAMLCSDGGVRVAEVKVGKQEKAALHNPVGPPLFELGIPGEYNLRATSFTWLGINRIAVGHNDGSLILWSLHPRRLLQRVQVHTTHILDICSAYPSHPYSIATVPVSGCVTLVDLNSPTLETTYVPTPTVNFQQNLLAWSEHLQSFISLWPASSPANSNIGLFHHEHFPMPRSIFSGQTQLMCLDIGAVHPFMLVGCADGSLWSCNVATKLMRDRHQKVWKMKIFEHEYRPVGGPMSAGDSREKVRGVVRILQGFKPEDNVHARSEGASLVKKGKGKTEKRGQATKGKKPTAARRNKVTGGLLPPRETDFVAEDDEVDGVEEMVMAEEPSGKTRGPLRTDTVSFDGARRMVLHEPLTRITNVEWNPNLDFGCWAAAAMGSGVVRVMDLGVEH
jgi:transcription factor C subunit 6